MRAILAAVLLVLAAHPAVAGSACYTPEMIRADVEKVAGVKELTTLRAVDIGFSELTDVTIWGDDSGHYLAVVFVEGCYAANRIMDAETVEDFINEHTKRADPL